MSERHMESENDQILIEAMKNLETKNTLPEQSLEYIPVALNNNFSDDTSLEPSDATEIFRKDQKETTPLQRRQTPTAGFEEEDLGDFGLGKVCQDNMALVLGQFDTQGKDMAPMRRVSDLGFVSNRAVYQTSPRQNADMGLKDLKGNVFQDKSGNKEEREKVDDEKKKNDEKVEGEFWPKKKQDWDLYSEMSQKILSSLEIPKVTYKEIDEFEREQLKGRDLDSDDEETILKIQKK